MNLRTGSQDFQATADWLRALLATGRDSRGPHDHIPHLEAARAIKDMDAQQAELARGAIGALLRGVLSPDPSSWSDPWTLELIYLLPHVADEQNIELLTSFAEKFAEEGNDTPIRVRQACLAALVDYTPRRDLGFWSRVANRRDQLGYAFSGMLGASPMGAVELITRVLSTPGPDRYCVLHLSLTADRLTQAERSVFVSAIRKKAEEVNTAAASSVLEWCQEYDLTSSESASI